MLAESSCCERALTGVVLRGVDDPGGITRLYACGGIERGRVAGGRGRGRETSSDGESDIGKKRDSHVTMTS